MKIDMSGERIFFAHAPLTCSSGEERYRDVSFPCTFVPGKETTTQRTFVPGNESVDVSFPVNLPHHTEPIQIKRGETEKLKSKKRICS